MQALNAGASVFVDRSLPRNKAWPLALLLCPTRELALQLSAQASQLVAGSQLTVKCVTGGTTITQQV
jgi:superfamily II DNA/RNA helicase